MNLKQMNTRVTGQVIGSGGEQFQNSRINDFLNATTRSVQVTEEIEQRDFQEAYNDKAAKAKADAVSKATSELTGETYTFDKREGETVYNEAYNQAMDKQITANLDTAIETKAAELAPQYQDDPDGFRDALGMEMESFAYAQGLDEQATNQLGIAVANSSARYLPRMAEKAAVKARDASLAATLANLETRNNIALGQIQGGNLANVEEDTNFLIHGVGELIASNQITAAKGQTMLRDWNQQVEERRITGEVDRYIESGSFTPDSLNETVADLKNWRLESRNQGLYEPAKLDAIFNKQLKRLSQANADYYAARGKELQATADAEFLSGDGLIDRKNKEETGIAQSVLG